MKTMVYYFMLQKYLWKKDISGLRHNITFSNVDDKEKSLFVSNSSAINMTTCDDQQRTRVYHQPDFSLYSSAFFFLIAFFFSLHVLC